MLDPPHDQKRPKLFSVDTCAHLLIENVRAENSPSFHFLLKNIVHAEVGLWVRRRGWVRG